MLILKAYRYRIYPSREQEKVFAVNFGHARYVYNHFLGECQRHYQEHKGDAVKRGLGYNDNAAGLKALKGDPEHGWLKEAHSQVLQQSLKDLDRAYENFFAKRAKYPKFHTKRGKQSIRYPQSVKVGEGWISIPKVGRVKAVIHRLCDGTIKNTTISKTKSGRYFASVQVEITIPDPPPPQSTAVGIDVGLKSFLVTSDGVSIPAQNTC
jgi:putative transposase